MTTESRIASCACRLGCRNPEYLCLSRGGHLPKRQRIMYPQNLPPPANTASVSAAFSWYHRVNHTTECIHVIFGFTSRGWIVKLLMRWRSDLHSSIGKHSEYRFLSQCEVEILQNDDDFKHSQSWPEKESQSSCENDFQLNASTTVVAVIINLPRPDRVSHSYGQLCLRDTLRNIIEGRGSCARFQQAEG